MASSGASSSTTNASAFEYDEIEWNDKLAHVSYVDINDAITPDPLDLDNDDDKDDFLAALQAIDPELVGVYEAWYGADFFWLRLPQPSEGTVCP